MNIKIIILSDEETVSSSWVTLVLEHTGEFCQFGGLFCQLLKHSLLCSSKVIDSTEQSRYQSTRTTQTSPPILIGHSCVNPIICV